MAALRFKSGTVTFCCVTTVIRTLAEVLRAVSSVTVSVTRVVPALPVMGVTVSVRLELVMASAMLELGISAILEETALTARRFEAVTSSETSNQAVGMWYWRRRARWPGG